MFRCVPTVRPPGLPLCVCHFTSYFPPQTYPTLPSACHASCCITNIFTCLHTDTQTHVHICKLLITHKGLPSSMASRYLSCLSTFCTGSSCGYILPHSQNLMLVSSQNASCMLFVWAVGVGLYSSYGSKCFINPCSSVNLLKISSSFGMHSYKVTLRPLKALHTKRMPVILFTYNLK